MTLTDEAAGSAESRWALLKDSVWLTVTNPIFGVGPGMFPVAQNTLDVDRGRPKGQWHQTHNSYTQISSEMGIPGLLLFMAAIVLSFKSLRSISNIQQTGPEVDDLKTMAACCRLSFITFCTMVFFAPVAYEVTFPIFCRTDCRVGFCGENTDGC